MDARRRLVYAGPRRRHDERRRLPRLARRGRGRRWPRTPASRGRGGARCGSRPTPASSRCSTRGEPTPAEDAISAAYASERLARYKCPRLFVRVDALPRGANNKLLRRAAARPTGRPRMVKLDILSDPICPWCYIGKANLDRALEPRPDHPFAIEWHPVPAEPRHARGRHGPARPISRRSSAARTSAAAGLRPRRRGRRGRGARRSTGRPDRAHAQHARRAPADPLGGARGAADAGRLGAVPRLLRARAATSATATCCSTSPSGAGLDRGDDRAAARRATPTPTTSAPATPMPASAASPACRPSSSANSHVVPGAQPPELWERVDRRDRAPRARRVVMTAHIPAGYITAA